MLGEHLAGSRRENDGLLHASSHLVGPLRHAMLDAAGAPRIKRPLVDDVRLMTGTVWHSTFESIFRKARLPVMCEVNVTPYLPEGWSGTADWVFWSDEYKAFVLGDLKTIKAEGVRWLSGPKEAHLWQLSAYWHALSRMGLPLVKGFGVLYLPMNQTYPDPVHPVVIEADPIPWDTIAAVMEQRWERTKTYLDAIPTGEDDFLHPPNTYLNEYLAAVGAREQTVRWNSKMQVFDVKLAPTWHAMFCDFPDELCDCNRQATEKIGHYTVRGVYVPRDGYDIDPLVAPSETDYRKRRV